MNAIDRNRVQIIKGADGPTHAIIPIDVWTAIEEALDHVDTAQREAAMSDEELLAGADTSGETFPVEVIEQLAAGAHPVKVYRRHRGLTQADLADRIGSQSNYISQIENGRPCGRQTLDLLARALGVDIDDLVQWPADNDRPTITVHKPPQWQGDREIVSFIGTWGADGISYFWVSGEALSDLVRGNAMDRDAALAAFTRHQPTILAACGRAVAEGRERAEGIAYVITTADFD